MDKSIGVLRSERKFASAELDSVRLDGVFSGYASLFGERDLGDDVVMPGAFSASLQRRSASGIRMLFQHDPADPIGTWVEIGEDARGLKVTGQLALATQRGREVHELMRAGAIDGLSIGFRTLRGAGGLKGAPRRIIEADLWEISVVTFPMLPGARIDTVKSRPLVRQLPTTREFERWLMHDAGLTRGEARTVITKGFAQLPGRRDVAGAPTLASGSLPQRMRHAAAMLRSSL